MSEVRRRRRRRSRSSDESAQEHGYSDSTGYGPDGYSDTNYSAANYSPPTRGRRAKRSGAALWIRRCLLTVLTILLLFVLYKGGRIGFLGWRLNQQANNIEAMARSGISASVEPILVELQGVSTTLNTLTTELAPVQPIFNQLDGLTRVGSTLAHATELTTVGGELTDLAIQGLTVGAPLLQERQSGTFPTALATLVENSTQTFIDLGDQANSLAPRIEALGNKPLLSSLAEPLREGGATMGFGAALLQLAPVLPELMATESPKTYLVLIQNNHELRATGGFISAVGQLTVENGEIAALEFKDSYDILNHDVEHPWAPEPMQKFLGIELLFLRDSNWSPDLPTAAQLIRTLYQQNEGVKADGIITVDLHAVQLLISGLGQLRVPDVAQPITSENIVDQIKLFWQKAPTLERPAQASTTASSAAESNATQSGAASAAGQDEQSWWNQRKDFMPYLGEAAIKKLQSGSADYLTIVQALHQALEERSIQIWVNDSEAAAQIAALGWDGSLRPPPEGDFLALVDSNFGFNKVDSVLERRLNYAVEWAAGDADNQPAIATASISYNHPVAVAGHQCDITPRYGSTYDDMSARCYFDYVRLYVPQGSRLRDVSGVDLTTTDSQPGENGTQVFSAYFMAKPGTETTIHFQYELPPRIQRSEYQLTVRRQSGTEALGFHAEIIARGFAPTGIQSQIQKGSYHWP